ncbi:MAG: DUF3109 family protein [Flavobacteriales bacterium]|nr:DUF3109 family protein [Flavobacteriales bacterium]MCZ2443940.1 DUF3109 family protein [Flavobacteriales bacterium]
MVEIEGKIVSSQLFDRRFVCDLNACKGICCVEGDSGAPLEPEEVQIMNEVFQQVRPFMNVAGIRAVEMQGTWIEDADGDAVTPLVDNKECAYVIFENGIAHCAFEKAWKNKKTTFRKPISCHLYPIRIHKTPNMEALNYDDWEVCKPACKHGERLNVPVYVFLKEAIIRKYGVEFYTQIEEAAKLWQDRK